MKINVTMNLQEDFKLLILNMIKRNYNIDLDAKNYSYLKSLKPFELFFKYLAFSKRIPSSIPRKVHISEELKKSEYYNIYFDVIEKIIKRFELGKEIKPYLNRDVRHIFKEKCPKDFLLNDWELYHLHLGKIEPNAKFCTRTKHVLFCKITDTDVYLIQILDHNEESSFASRKLLTILKRNWEEVFDFVQLDEIKSIGKKYTDEEYRNLRESGILTFIEIDGKYYFSPTMGVASSRDSSRDVRIAMNTLNMLNDLQQIIFDNSKMIYDFIIRCHPRHKKPMKIQFKLISFSGKKLVVKDIFSKTNLTLEYDENLLYTMIINYKGNKYIIKYNTKEDN